MVLTVAFRTLMIGSFTILLLKKIPRKPTEKEETRTKKELALDYLTSVNVIKVMYLIILDNNGYDNANKFKDWRVLYTIPMSCMLGLVQRI